MTQSNHTTNQELFEQLQIITEQIELLQIAVNNIQLQLATPGNRNNSFDDSEWNPFDETELFNIGDTVVIIHRTRTRNQVGIQGTVTKITNKFVWIKTDKNHLKKHKKYVTGEDNYNQHRDFYHNH